MDDFIASGLIFNLQHRNFGINTTAAKDCPVGPRQKLFVQ
jgi:hypothetical protein